MRISFFSLLLLLTFSLASAQQPYGYGGAPGQVVSMDPYASTGSANYGTPSYSGWGGGAAPMPSSQVPPVGGAGISSGSNPLLSYGLLEGYYKYTTFSNESLKGAHGVGVSLSAELFRPFYIKGSFDWGTAGGGSRVGKLGSYDFNSVSIGGGAYFALTDRFHLFAEVGGNYTNLDATRSSLSFSDGSVYLTPGMRFAATDFFELDLSLTATSADTYDSKVVDIAGYYKLFSSMDVGIGTGFGDETRNFFAGIRFRW